MAGHIDEFAESASSVAIGASLSMSSDSSQVTNSITTSGLRFQTTTGVSQNLPSTSTSIPAPSSSKLVAGSSTSVLPGPIATASGLPTNQQSAQQGGQNVDSAHSSRGGLSASNRKIVTMTTTIFGTILLALLILVIWRRWKGASYAQIVRFRPQTGEIINRPRSGSARLTALPIYRQDRISFRSSRHPSLLNLQKITDTNSLAMVPPSRTHRFRNSSMTQLWKSSNPPKTPTKVERGIVNDLTPRKQYAESSVRAASFDRTSAPALPIMTHSALSKSAPNVLEWDLPEMPESPLPPGIISDRWSWTNSQAPSTPRIEPPNGRTSLTSISRARTVASWVKTQGKSKMSEPPTEMSERSAPLLPSQTPKLVLVAPPKRRRLSKANRPNRVDSLGKVSRPSRVDSLSKASRPGRADSLKNRSTAISRPLSTREERQAFGAKLSGHGPSTLRIEAMKETT